MKKPWWYLLLLTVVLLIGCSDDPEAKSSPAHIPEIPTKTLRAFMDDAPVDEITIRYYATQGDRLLFGVINRKMDPVFYKSDSIDRNPLGFVLYEYLNESKWENSRIGYCISDVTEYQINPNEVLLGYISLPLLQTQFKTFANPLALRLSLQSWNEKGYYHVKSEPFEIR